MKRYLILAGMVAVVLLAACSPAAATPTPAAMMPAATATGEAMMSAGTPNAGAAMENATPTAEAMMPAATPTGEAMMAQATPTGEAMMPAATPTGEAMMAQATPTVEAMMPAATPTAEAMMGNLPAQMTTAHFATSSPKHGAVLAKVPAQVELTFKAAPGEGSMLTVTKDGTMLHTGQVMMDSKMLALSVTLPSDAGDGLYLVKYTACWPDKTCEHGQVAFQVNSKMGQ